MPETFAEACNRLDALNLTARATQEGFTQPVAMTRTLYEMVNNPPKRDDPDARLGELLRTTLWNEGKDGKIARTHDYLTHLPVKGRSSKYVDLRLFVVDGCLIIALKGEGDPASAYEHAEA